jgi:hypothetical protein
MYESIQLYKDLCSSQWLSIQVLFFNLDWLRMNMSEATCLCFDV